MYKANNNKYECNIIGHPSSHNPFDTIAPINEYSFVFDNSVVSFRGDKERLFEDMTSEYKDYNFAYCQFEYIRNDKRNNGMWHDYHFTETVYCWTSKSLAAILSDHGLLSITFYNAPITKPSEDLRYINARIKGIGEEKRKKIQRYKEKRFFR